MGRKVFLSFLGNSIYKETNYIAMDQDENSVIPTRFIQESIVRNFCSDFGKGDRIFIFTTKGALSNWEEREHFNKHENETVLYDPLKERLAGLKLSCKTRNVLIVDGESPEELWQIFDTVFKIIDKNDEITFDITHGFRTLPMFNMVLINYAKLLKNVSISGIYYGNYEASYSKNGKKFSPIWNLKDFETLQEWTNSAQLFLKAGYAEKIGDMMLARSITGGAEIKRFSEEILTNRGMALTQGDSAVAIKNILVKTNEVPPVMKPIFESIEKQFGGYQENDVLNGLLAVEWCINHNLIQQGYTLMSEFLPSFILNYIGEKIDDKEARNTVNGLLGINGKKENFRFTPEIRNKQEKIIDKALMVPHFKELCERNRSINSQNRDDINHGGFRDKPKEYNAFKEELLNKYLKLKNVIYQIEALK